ncbi:hypothetical protein RJT34_24433 [Clitoria ternatea]|uniref:Uncharacterized protein n=1 Tax=Clitoria ternatea TaxID=43366 RepID=A0AAN9IHH6_CLITE
MLFHCSCFTFGYSQAIQAIYGGLLLPCVTNTFVDQTLLTCIFVISTNFNIFASLVSSEKGKRQGKILFQSCHLRVETTVSVGGQAATWYLSIMIRDVNSIVLFSYFAK